MRKSHRGKSNRGKWFPTKNYVSHLGKAFAAVFPYSFDPIIDPIIIRAGVRGSGASHITFARVGRGGGTSHITYVKVRGAGGRGEALR